jgi:hypothetical protein
MGWAGDYASAVLATAYNETSEPAVSLYGSAEFGCDTAGVFFPGSYGESEMKRNHMHPGEVRGLRVPAGLVA